jgi:hypothetical protein
MPMTSKWLAILALAAPIAAQQAAIDPERAFKVSLPPGAPVALTSANWDQSQATARGGALVVDLHSTLHLRNESPRRIRAISLQVVAQEVTPGGKGSVTVPSLDAAPGESFSVRVDLRLMRPLSRSGGALVEVSLDGLLFDDLTFYGPDLLKSRRSLLAWELEARRDRRLLLAALQQGGRETPAGRNGAGFDRGSPSSRAWKCASPAPRRPPKARTRLRVPCAAGRARPTDARIGLGGAGRGARAAHRGHQSLGADGPLASKSAGSSRTPTEASLSPARCPPRFEIPPGQEALIAATDAPVRPSGPLRPRNRGAVGLPGHGGIRQWRGVGARRVRARPFLAKCADWWNSTAATASPMVVTQLQRFE